jgi:hypothetical protein
MLVSHRESQNTWPQIMVLLPSDFKQGNISFYQNESTQRNLVTKQNHFNSLLAHNLGNRTETNKPLKPSYISYLLYPLSYRISRIWSGLASGARDHGALPSWRIPRRVQIIIILSFSYFPHHTTNASRPNYLRYRSSTEEVWGDDSQIKSRVDTLPA